MPMVPLGFFFSVFEWLMQWIKCWFLSDMFCHIKIIIQFCFNEAQVREMSLSSDMCGYTHPSLKSDLYSADILHPFYIVVCEFKFLSIVIVEVQHHNSVHRWAKWDPWSLWWSLNVVCDLRSISHCIALYLCLNNSDLQEGEIWGEEVLCSSSESLFHMSQGGKQKQVASAFLMQHKMAIRLPEAALVCTFW